jgi:hypothetical protein
MPFDCSEGLTFAIAEIGGRGREGGGRGGHLPFLDWAHDGMVIMAAEMASAAVQTSESLPLDGPCLCALRSSPLGQGPPWTMQPSLDARTHHSLHPAFTQPPSRPLGVVYIQ